MIREKDFRKGLRAYRRGRFRSALNWLLPFADKGDPIAQYLVATIYDLALAGDESIELAEKYYRLAADRGFVAAYQNLGSLLNLRFSNEDKKKEGSQWSSLAREKEFPENLLWYVEGCRQGKW